MAKLLFDQNISFRIIKFLEEHFEEVAQVHKIGLEDFLDSQIWEYAEENNYSIVTFDADFADLAYVKGHPPKIIWLRTGNMTTRNVANLIVQHRDTIISFICDEEFFDTACLEIC